MKLLKGLTGAFKIVFQIPEIQQLKGDGPNEDGGRKEEATAEVSQVLTLLCPEVCAKSKTALCSLLFLPLWFWIC